ncbi:hypothetical protein GCM10023190_12870 [Enteractinococcus fodinae]|uniref:TQXA domain-containing protein n=1 Tax=Enteractinococcus fodinae TaxID=684663 RepID=A0ABU2AZN4_9MICC|nr:thioester domain-containing protein [Enteractinococcus fodinae]MDR7346234.1 TQXA domain-containing protein [Enteractinococcus fodinae]
MKTTVLATLTCLGMGATSLLMPGLAAANDASVSVEEELTAQMGPAQEYQRGLSVNGVAPTLRSVVVNGESILAYCIEYWIQAADPDHESAVTTWDEFTGDNHFKSDPQVRQRVAWILRHSYPTLTLDELAQQTGTVQLSAAEAISATQAAIWHFTDDFVPDGKLTVESGPTAQLAEHSSDNVRKIFAYLTGDSNTGLTEQEVQASVTLEDATEPNVDVPEPLSSVIADDGDHLLGPIRLNASTPEVDLSVHSAEEGVHEQLSVLDAEGEPVDMNQSVHADELWIHVPAEVETGSVQLTAESVEYGYTGRLIIPEPDGQRRFQTIVVVDQATDHAATEIELAWEQVMIEEPAEDPPAEEPPAEVRTPEASPSPTVEEPLIQEPEPEPEQSPVQQPEDEEPEVSQTPTASTEPEAPEESEPVEPSSPQESVPEEIDEAEPAAELATTGAHETRNILIALGTIAAGIGLLVVNRFRRARM